MFSEKSLHVSLLMYHKCISLATWNIYLFGDLAWIDRLYDTLRVVGGVLQTTLLFINYLTYLFILLLT